MKKRIERMGRIEAAINPMYCVPKRSDLSLIGSAFEAAGWKNRSRLGQCAGADWDTFDGANLMIFSETVAF